MQVNPESQSWGMRLAGARQEMRAPAWYVGDQMISSGTSRGLKKCLLTRFCLPIIPIMISSIMSNKKKNICSQKHLHKYWQQLCHNIQKTKRAPVSINKRIGKQIVAGLYNQILLCNTDDNIGKSPEYWGANEAKLKMYISYGYIYMKSQNGQN